MPKNNSCVTMRGRLCGQPSIKTYESGHKLASFNLAMDDDYQNAKGEWVERTVFVHTQAWNDLASRIENLGLGQGDLVSVQAQLQMVPATEDKPQWHKLRLDSLRLIEKKGNRAHKPADSAPGPDPATEAAANAEAHSDDVPF